MARGAGAATATGHAIEVRVYAENPDEGFLPSPGTITHLRPPAGPGIRDDSGVYEGWTVPTAYDPLLSKVIAWAPDRAGAIRRMVCALNEYDVRGIRTTIEFCRNLVGSPAFAAADFDTTYVDRLLEQSGRFAVSDRHLVETAAIAAAMWAALRPKSGAAQNGQPPAADAAGHPESLWAQRARLESLR
jgi:acetyl-CoA carboxylase biotin carboxylase subunit